MQLYIKLFSILLDLVYKVLNRFHGHLHWIWHFRPVRTHCLLPLCLAKSASLLTTGNFTPSISQFNNSVTFSKLSIVSFSRITNHFCFRADP